uniref:Peptidyl-glycine alpha-amidating monooxygenase B-like n=1 Tax=Sinocyclocheilus anshuiensis TaxID=1608454 RepID=A0A671M4X1_9TELE
DPNDCSRTRQPFVLSNPYNFSLDIRIPGVIPTEVRCIFFVILDFVPHASMDTAHHMILYGCKTPYATQGYWDCGKELGTCRDQAKIMYAWARNAPPTKLPKDVGFKVGGDTRMNYFVLQIHYGDVTNFRDRHRDCSGLTLRMTSKPQPFIAGMYLMMSVDTVIPPGKKVTNADIACTYTSSPMYPFAFRTHTHSLGKVVSGYRVRNGQWTQIGRQSPLLPQAFYPVANTIDVKNGDILAARCVFTGEGRTTNTQIGGTSNDEMCNFYIMYYMDNSRAVPYMSCGDDSSSELFRNIPSEANIPIPVSPDHMMSMKHESAPQKDVVDLQEPKREEEVLDQGDLYSLLSKLLGEREDVVHMHKYNPTEVARAQKRLMAEIDSIMQKKDLGWPRLGYKTKEDAILARDRVHKFHQLESTVSPSRSRTVPVRQPTTGEVTWHSKHTAETHLVEVSDWPEADLQLGQVSGLALNSNGDLIIFHRGDHIWGINSFINGIYQQKDLGPIQQSTIMVVDPVRGKVLKASGRNMFYMPHGITTDKDDNYWVTDVALHQVIKLSSDGKDRQLLVWGEAFEPGSDKKHFCQPTDVAVDPVTGNVYVSDGYCNSRILKFSPEGKYISHWGAGSLDRKRERVPFWIPHSLAFLPDKRELCVADRDNGRIQCFMADTGEFVKEIKKEQFGGEVFAIAYSPAQGGLIYAVNGEPPYGQAAPLQGFIINYSTKEILDSFSPDTQEFKLPHDIVVTADGSIFVGDAASDSVIKFVLSAKAEHRSVKKGGIKVQEIEDSLSHTGKAAGSLNLGNFFASYKGYTRHGFDRLSTEGSDLEKDDEDGTDSENEEYSAPPAPMSSS